MALSEKDVVAVECWNEKGFRMKDVCLAVEELKKKQRANDQIVVNILQNKLSEDFFQLVIKQLGMSQVIIDEVFGVCRK